MSAQVFWCGTSRRSLRCSCWPIRPARVCYSRPALSFVAGRTQYPEASTSTGPSGRTRTASRHDSHHAVANARSPLDPTRLDRYLVPTDLEPTLDDVERCRPEGFSRPDSSCFAAEYTNLQEALCRSFSKDQLRRFTELYKLDPIWSRSSRRKTEYAESIMEKAWGWPSLKEVERKRRDMTEVLVKSFTVTPSQLFLMMGKDGVDLLQLSMRYNVHISLMSNPLALRVEGLRGSLKGLSEYISSLKKGVVDKIFELPTGRPVRPDLLQRISRLSGAYVENHGNRGKIRICAKGLSNINAAERLALRASLEVGMQASTVCYDPPNKIRDSPVEIPEPHRYSVYPFVTPCSFPWTMHSGGAFRLRRVADWLGADTYEDITSTGGLTRNPHRLLNLDRSREELGHLVCLAMPENASYRRRIITASPGHVLMSSGDSSQRTAILPPFRGSSSLPDILRWVGTSGMLLNFVPSVPPAMVTVAISKRRVLHRLIYRTLPQVAGQVTRPSQHVLKFEMELSSNGAAIHDPENAPEFKNVLSPDRSGTTLFSSRGSTSRPDSLPEASNNMRSLNCQVGRETYVNLMLPDRPTDVQFCIFDWDNITSIQQPQALLEYADEFYDFLTNKAQLSQPDPPSTINYEGKGYYLYDSLSLQQSNNSILLPTVSNDYHTDNLVEVSNESIVDLQGTQKVELCQVEFDGTIEGANWKRFLAACDHFSIVGPALRNKDKTQTNYLDT